MNKIISLIGVVCVVVLVGCGVKPEPIVFGEDHCTHCRMSIADPKFGAELVTDKGKVFKFDALECMVPYLQENSDTEYAHILAIAYDEPGELKPVANLKFVFSESYKSPMGGNLAALNQSASMEGGPELLDWQELKSHSFDNH
jgi:copper chaperone NosL